jgi:hypothetical protein
MLQISDWKELAEYFLLGSWGSPAPVGYNQRLGHIPGIHHRLVRASTPLFMVIFSGLLLKEKLGNWGYSVSLWQHWGFCW